MMKIKDFFCLLAGVALLVLAFQLKGFAEEACFSPDTATDYVVYEALNADYSVPLLKK